MKLVEIKQRFEKEGYKTLLRSKKDTLIGEHLIAGINNDNTNFEFGNVFRIWIINNKIMLDFMSQILENIFFDNENDLINFIKTKFPLK